MLLALSLSAQSNPEPARPGTLRELADLNGTRGDVILEGDPSYPWAGVILRPKASWPNVNVVLGDNATSSLRILSSASNLLFAVQPSGSSYFQKSSSMFFDTSTMNPYIYMRGEANSYYPAIYWGNETGATTATIWVHRDLGMFVEGYPNKGIFLRPGQVMALRADPSGTVGIGVGEWDPPPAAKLHVKGGTTPLRIDSVNSGAFPVQFRDTLGTEGYANGILMDMAGNSLIRVSNLQIGSLGTPLISSVNAPMSLNTNSAQDVVIGQAAYSTRLRVEGTGVSTFAGSVTVAGNIAAKYQDVAEWVPTEKSLSPGTVVIVDPRFVNHVAESSRAYDTAVAGVVSAQPGISLGEAGASKTLVATTGRVRVRVDASKHPIATGDLLVTSDRPGVAMKSIPVEIQGIAMHRPGTVVGKALEPLERGQGEILVLLSLQ